MNRAAALLLFVAGCGLDLTPEATSSQPAEDAIYYGQSSPSLYTSLTTAQQNAVVALCTTDGQGFCTGTMVSPHVVLTAGHCIDTPQGVVMGPNDIVVHVGSNYESPLARLDVQAVDYKNWSLSYADDIGIVILEDTYASATPFSFKRGDVSGILYNDAQSVGYGRTQTSSDWDPNPYRNWTTMDVEWVGNNQITVNGHGATGVAPGDSGGPILYDFGSGPEVAGVASTSEEGWVYIANYTSVEDHESWIQGYIDYYDNPACLSACSGLECGSTGSCECGSCERGYECVANQCQEIQPGVGGACATLDTTYTQCNTKDDCASDELCFVYPDGPSECAEICGPEPCAPGNPSSFCMATPLQGGGYVYLCVESQPRSCSTEYQSCQATGGQPGTCLYLFQGEPLSCYASCETVVTCPQGTSCVPYQTDCSTACATVDCGMLGDCDCGTECDYGSVCVGNDCVCSPTCDNKQCGSDGCDGFCGTCPSGYICNGYGRCISSEAYYPRTRQDEVEGNCGNCGAAPAGAWVLVALLTLRRRRVSR